MMCNEIFAMQVWWLVGFCSSFYEHAFLINTNKKYPRTQDTVTDIFCD